MSRHFKRMTHAVTDSQINDGLQGEKRGFLKKCCHYVVITL